MASRSIMDKYKARIKELESRLRERDSELDKQIQRVGSQAQYIRDLEQKCEDLYDYPKQRGEDVKELNRRERAAKHHGDILTDDEAESSIDSLFAAKARGISRTFFRDIRWDRRFDKDSDCLPLSVLHSPFLRDQWDLVRKNDNMSTTALIDALLSSMMAEMILKDAFYRYKPDFKQKLNGIYSQALNEDFDEAVAWKVRTAKLSHKLTAPIPVETRSGSSHRKSGDRSSEIEKACKAMLKTLRHILNLHSPISGPYEPKELESRVRDLVDSTVTLADGWHEREFHIEVIDFQYFNRRGFHWYSESMPRYATAFSPNLAIDPERKYEIVGVISPGFIRYEKTGLDDVQEVVWRKASVLLAEDAKAAPMSSSLF
ncbi:hypothetical protein TWF696_008643 [Orbilia brochopaga]|uniref:Uncharacterized protein n=1 Tax=Orbilia brochopaga TaxID=3140254 RepID=A0AAV9UHN7_9PEZI